MNTIALSSICLLLCIVSMVDVRAISLEQLDQPGDKPTYTLAVVENPEMTIRVLENLLRSIVFSASVDVPMQSTHKRGLDLGISRGFSGSQAGKHLLGLSAASFANGPGR